MSGPANAIIGEQDSPTTLPETEVPQDLLTEEKKRAKYSKTAEFKKIKAYWEDRKKYLQTFLPNGMEVRFTVPDEKVAQQWVLAANMIVEIDAFLGFYEGPVEVVADSERE